MDRARFRRRRRTGAPQVETRNLLPAPFMRAIGGRRADAGANPQSPYPVWPRRGPGKRAHLSITRAPSRATASRKSSFSIPSAAPPPRLRRSDGVGAGGDDSEAATGPVGKRFLDAAPAEVGVDPSDDLRDAVLASSAKAPSSRWTRVAGLADASGSRLSPRGGHWSSSGGHTGEGLADDRQPVRDQARFARPRAAKASAMSPGVNSAAAWRAARGLHRRFDTGAGIGA